MRTIRKTRPGESHIHNHGTVAGGETIAVDDDTAAYLVDSGGYEYAESDAQSESDTDESDGPDNLAESTRETRDADADELTPLEDADGADAADLIDDGVCPWCDDYDGESVGRHASAAHTEEWEAYKEATE
jgi:hypothetical protein